MNKELGIAVIVGICVIVLVIGLLKKKMELVLAFMVRVVVGVTAIFFANRFLESQSINIMVGVNPVSVLTVGTLGIGGFALLYGIMAYRLL